MEAVKITVLANEAWIVEPPCEVCGSDMVAGLAGVSTDTHIIELTRSATCTGCGSIYANLDIVEDYRSKG